MPTINGSASGPPGNKIHWSSQVVFYSPIGSCSGGPNFNSSILDGYGSTFSPVFNGIFGGDLLFSLVGPGPEYRSASWYLGGTNPDGQTIRNEIGGVGSPFDSNDLNRIACQESGMNQFEQNGHPILGGDGDAGIFQICYNRATEYFWNWKANVARAKVVLDYSKTWASTVPGRVRNYVVRGYGPYADADDFTTTEWRFEAIHAYNAGNDYNNDGFYQWDNVWKLWYEAPQGGQSN